MLNTQNQHIFELHYYSFRESIRDYKSKLLIRIKNCKLFSLFLIFLLCFFSCSSFDLEVQYKAAEELELAGHNEEAIKLLKKIIKKSNGQGIYFGAQYKLARNYYFLNDVTNAQKVAENLLSTVPDDIDPRIPLATRMILLSIERKISSK